MKTSKINKISKIKNPFRFGAIVNNEQFCNRKIEIKTIKQYIYDGYSLWLFSPRRYGKSSLVRKIFEEIDDTITIYIDLYNVKSIDDFAKKYSKALATNLFDWKTELKKASKIVAKYFSNIYPKISIDSEGVPSMSIEKTKITDQIDIDQILNMPELFAKDKGIKICVAFDEFQEVERIDPFIVNWMRTAFQNHNNVNYIFLGSKQTLMEEIFTDTKSPFYEFAIKMDLLEISEKELSKFIKDKFKNSNINILDKTIKDILDWSELHPHFTQYFSSVVFDLLRNGEDQSDENFTELWMNKIINSQGIIFQTIYDQLSTNQRRVISAIAQIDAQTEIFADTTRKKYDLPVSSSLAITINALIKKSLAYKTPLKKYRIDNPVFKEWLVRLNTGKLQN